MPTIDELLQLVDQAIAYNEKEPEDFESNVHLQAEMSCVAENAGILATALRERLVAEQNNAGPLFEDGPEFAGYEQRANVTKPDENTNK